MNYKSATDINLYAGNIQGKAQELEEQRGDDFADGYRIQQDRGSQSITQQMLMEIGYLQLRVKGAQKQRVYERS